MTANETAPNRYCGTLLYDADCGFCLWIVHQVMRWDRHNRVRAVALQNPEADELLGGMDQERKMSSWHLVDADGEIHSGGAALAPLFRVLPWLGPVAALVEAFPRGTSRFYEIVARNRSSISRMLGTRRS